MNAWTIISWLLQLTDYHTELRTAPASISHNYSSFPYYSKTYSGNSPTTIWIYFIIQILPFLPLGLEDQLFLDHLGDLVCLLHQGGLLDLEYHVAPIKNRKTVIGKSHSMSDYSQKIHLIKSAVTILNS